MIELPSGLVVPPGAAIDPGHPLASVLQHVWTGDAPAGGRDRFRGAVAGVHASATRHGTPQGLALLGNGTVTGGLSSGVPTINRYPFTMIGYGYFTNASGAWQLGQFTSSGGGTIARIAIASSTAVSLDLRYNFGTNRQITVTLPTAIGTPILMIAHMTSATDYWLCANGQVATGSASPGTLNNLDRYYNLADTFNGGMWMQGIGQGVPLPLGYALRVTTEPQRELSKLFRRRIWVPVSTGGAVSLTVDNSAHAHAADSLALTTDSALSVADAFHAHAADALTLATGTALAVAEALHAHAADALTFTTDSTLSTADALHAHAADAPTLSTGTALSPADALHAHAADAPTLTTDSTLAVAEALHAHATDNVVLEVAGTANLTVNDAAHAHTADVLVLTSAHDLTVADAAHSHSADGLVLTAASVLAIQEVLHAHAADNLTLEVTGSAILLLASGLHAHTSDGLSLTVDAWLAVADATHGHSADNVVFTFGGALPTESLPLMVPLQNSYMLVAPERSLMIVRV